MRGEQGDIVAQDTVNDPVRWMTTSFMDAYTRAQYGVGCAALMQALVLKNYFKLNGLLSRLGTSLQDSNHFFPLLSEWLKEQTAKLDNLTPEQKAEVMDRIDLGFFRVYTSENDYTEYQICQKEIAPFLLLLMWNFGILKANGIEGSLQPMGSDGGREGEYKAAEDGGPPADLLELRESF